MHTLHSPRLRTALGATVLIALIMLAVLRSHAGTRLDGWTIDEPWHVVAGVSYLRTGDFRLNPEHPPLVKLAVGLAVPDDFTLRPLAPLVEKAQERELVEETMFFDNDSTATQAAARKGMWLFHGLLLLALGVALWRAVGFPWAVGTLAFLALEPTVSAHLPVVMTDLPLALSFGLAVACAGLLASGWRWTAALATGIAVGLMLGSKHSALPGVVGIAIVLAIATLFGLRRQPPSVAARTALLRLGKLAVAALLAVTVLWAQYGFHFHAGPDGSDGFNRAMEDKIADLSQAHWRWPIAFADRHRLLPRAYLWGLTDTVRAGVEGRGQSMHRIWGTLHKGSPPWFTWPSIMLSKVPIALLLLALLGVAVLARSRLETSEKWTLAVLLGGSLAHLAALMSSQGTYGGIRHALPLVVTLALLAGAAVAYAVRERARTTGAVAALLLVATLALTLREPRLWEYHNELAGGTADAYLQFGNEGLDLGQRFPEIRSFHDRVIVPTGQPMFANYWFGEKQAIAAKMAYRRRILGMEDDNIEGVYEGFFFDGASVSIPQPEWGWDPDEAFKDTRIVGRLGYVVVRQGRVTDPIGRASSMYHTVIEYLYHKNGTNDALVVQRLEEVLQVLPMHAGAAIELGNAWLRQGDAAKARTAYARPLQQQNVPIEALVREQLQAQLDRIDAGETTLTQLRNPWME